MISLKAETIDFNGRFWTFNFLLSVSAYLKCFLMKSSTFWYIDAFIQKFLFLGKFSQELWYLIFCFFLFLIKISSKIFLHMTFHIIFPAVKKVESFFMSLDFKCDNFCSSSRKLYDNLKFLKKSSSHAIISNCIGFFYVVNLMKEWKWFQE